MSLDELPDLKLISRWRQGLKADDNIVDTVYDINLCGLTEIRAGTRACRDCEITPSNSLCPLFAWELHVARCQKHQPLRRLNR